MKKFFLYVLPVTVLLLGMTACKGNEPDQPAAPKAKYTIIIYGNAGGSMDNIIESFWERAKPLMKSKDVRLGVFYKYGKKAEDATQKYAEPGTLLDFELTSETNLDSLRYTAATTGWEDYELYDPELLQITIDMMVDEMPADNYVLLIWGHGGGFDPEADYPKDLRDGKNKAPQAVVYDEWLPTAPDARGGEGMSMYELGEAISKSKVHHFKAIFFHNCLIGNMETLDEIYDKTDYIFSSMHALYSEGTVVENLINALYDNPDFEAAGKATIADIKGWEDAYKEDKANGDLNFIKTADFASIEPVIARLSQRLTALYPTQSIAIDQAFDKTYRVTDRHPFFDVMDYANQVAQATDDAELKTIAADLKTAFDKIWVSRHRVICNPQANMDEFTLSVFMMDKENYAKQVGDYRYTYRDAYEFSRFHKKTGWGNWLNTNTHVPQGNPTGQIL